MNKDVGSFFTVSHLNGIEAGYRFFFPIGAYPIFS
jgi:hypothetical protein